MCVKLLIVDDEKLFADTLAEGFDWAGLGFSDVQVAYDGQSAWPLLEKGDIDLLLCDIEMPFMDGLELQKRINAAKLATRTILLTSHADFSYVQMALRQGARDYLLKPTDESELISVVEQAVADLPGRDGAAAGERRSRPLRMACDYIDAHVEEKIGRDDVARAVFLNPDYLNRLFKKELGMSLAHYILSKKMERAQVLLQTTGATVGEIGSMLGFTNFSAFSYAFKRSVGLTPSDYRRDGK